MPGEVESARNIIRAVAVADGQDGLDAGSTGADEGLSAVLLEARAFEMAMTVYKHKSK